LALVDGEALKIHKSKDVQEPTLHDVGNLPKLAFDHKQIIAYAHERLKAKLEYTNAAFAMLPETFTFYQLQTTYELVLQTPLDKRNFRKKFLSLGLIKPTGKYLAGGRHRPAELFKFVENKPVEIERRF
jgi:8-oxo-dGTP diphosphatase